MPYCPQCNEAGHLHCADPERCGNTKPLPRRKPKKWYPIECEHGFDCCPICDGERRDPLTLKPV